MRHQKLPSQRQRCLWSEYIVVRLMLVLVHLAKPRFKKLKLKYKRFNIRFSSLHLKTHNCLSNYSSRRMTSPAKLLIIVGVSRCLMRSWNRLITLFKCLKMWTTCFRKAITSWKQFSIISSPHLTHLKRWFW